jgi:sodium-dependent dicarboxylate transporter 2/3/5
MAEADARANGDRAVCSGILNTPYATGVMLMVAYGASIGGIGTPVGSPPNLITLGLLRKLAAVDFDFFSWMRLMIPMLTVMGVVLFGLLYLLHRPGKRITQACQALPEFVNQQRRDLGAWTRGELNTAVAFFVAVVLWVLPGVVALVLGKEAPLAVFLTTRFTEATAALIAALLLFILPINLREERFTLSWSQAAQIDWGTIILFGGGLSLGSLMFQTGVAEAFGKFVTGITGPTSVWGLTAVAAGFAIILSETTSNTAASNMVVPVVIVLAQQSGLNPLIPALGACLGASFGFMLPVSTPPNAIAYGTGLVPILSMVRAGLLFDIVGWIVIVGGMRVLCPLLGIQ